eukprot:4224424-Amphidinium_carterae.1
MVPKSLRADKRIILEAVSRKGELLEYASKVLREDLEVITAAARQTPHAVKFMCQDNREAVLGIVERDWRVLGSLDPQLRRDSYIAMIAIQQDGRALSGVPPDAVLEESFWRSVEPY